MGSSSHWRPLCHYRTPRAGQEEDEPFEEKTPETSPATCMILGCVFTAIIFSVLFAIAASYAKPFLHRLVDLF